MSSTIFANFKAPGVRVNETTSGYRALELASFGTVYMIGSSSSGSQLVPTQVTSLADFNNQFGSSPSADSIKLFFRNDKRGLLYFVRTAVPISIQITVTTATAGAYPLTIASTAGSATVTYTAGAGETAAQITSGLIAAVNNSSIASGITARTGSANNRLVVYLDNPSHPFLDITSTNNGLTIANLNAQTEDRREVIIDRVPTTNTNYSLFFFGDNITITNAVTSSSTVTGIRDALVAAINAHVTINTKVLATAVGTNRIFITNIGQTIPISVFVTSGGDGMRVINNNLGNPRAADYVYTIENAFDSEDEWSQGFLIAPEAFQLLTNQTDRLSVGSAMEALASDEQFDWAALIDAGTGLSVAQAQTEGLLYTSPQGHSSFYYPHVIDLEGAVVPASAGVAGIATRRYKEEGFQQPPAGAKFPMLGVTDVVTKVNTQQQEVLNPLGINVVRNLRNKGVVVWAMRTRSNNEFYRFLNTRVIMNVLNGTLRRGFDNELFSVIDGQGVLLNNISQTATAVCSRLWRGKALFGATEAEAFEVKCDFENNTPEELEQGNVILEVYVVPVPPMERLLIQTIRVSIGTLPLNQNQVEAIPLESGQTQQA